MKNFKYILTTIVLVSSCGGGSEDKQTQFYKKEQTTPQKLEVSIDASGVIEAISSVEIKSKASGEVLFLGAEVGDFIDKGFWKSLKIINRKHKFKIIPIKWTNRKKGYSKFKVNELGSIAR